jgi:phospholipase/carboxylesterase
MKDTLETVEVETGPQPSAAVVWLHGLGADGHDFEPLVPELSWPGAPAIRYVFPHAPVRPVTINGGMPMRAWYDIVSLTLGRDHDQRGIAWCGASANAESTRNVSSWPAFPRVAR